MGDQGNSTRCAECVHGKRNTGIVIPRQEIAYFCLKARLVTDDAVKDILEALLLQMGESSSCPLFDPGEALDDSYRARDLDGSKISKSG